MVTDLYETGAYDISLKSYAALWGKDHCGYPCRLHLIDQWGQQLGRSTRCASNIRLKVGNEKMSCAHGSNAGQNRIVMTMGRTHNHPTRTPKPGHHIGSPAHMRAVVKGMAQVNQTLAGGKGDLPDHVRISRAPCHPASGSITGFPHSRSKPRHPAIHLRWYIRYPFKAHSIDLGLNRISMGSDRIGVAHHMFI